MKRAYHRAATLRGRLARLAAAALALLLAPACAGAARLAIVGIDIVDPGSGTIARDRTVVVEAQRIVAVGARDATAVPRGAARVDGRGRWLIPGLVDAHVHLFNTYSKRPPNDWALPLFVANGVTTVREMAADIESLAVVARWNAQSARGAIVAPQVHAAIAVGGDVARIDAKVDAARTAGAAYVKVFSPFPPESLAALVAAAHARRLRVVGHVPWRMTAVDAVGAGLATVEHLFQVYEACSALGPAAIAARRALDATRAEPDPAPQLLALYDDAACRRAARSLARHPHAQVPTLVLLRRPQPEPADAGADPRWPLLRADEQARWSRILASRAAADDALDHERAAIARRIVAALHAAGVPIAAGTDAPMPRLYPGWSLHDELALLVDAGLSPAAALRAATVEAHRALGLDAEAATIAAGARADLVLLDGDPLADIANTRRIRAVVVGGRLFDRAALDRLVRSDARP